MKEDILQSALKEVQLYGDFQSHKAEIDAEDLSWILQILSTNLYSDPIGSLIREYSSNAWDANVEAGNKDKPIEVGIQTDKDSGSYWYVTDLGPGLSPQRINDVYRKFGKSTKRNSNESIGMMGLGKFSGLSYTNEIYITTRVDGLQYEYLMHKSDGVPQIDLLVTKATTLPNGTTIKIYIKSWYDKNEFIKKTREQLAYFENVYFNVDSQPNLNTEFKLYKGKYITASSLDNRELRLKIGPVSYPIDWSVLKDHPIKHIQNSLRGVAIDFNIGEIAITPNRESVLYNKETINNIIKALDSVKQEFIDIYNNQVHEYEDVAAFLQSITEPIFKLGELIIYARHFLAACGASVIHPKLKGLDLKLFPRHFYELFFGYEEYTSIHNGKKSKGNVHHVIASMSGNWLLTEKYPIDSQHTKYLCETLQKNSWKVIRKHKRIKLYPSKGISSDLCYYTLLRLKDIPKTDWRATIKKFQDWQKAFINKHSVKYDDYVPTKQWLKDSKSKSKTNVLNYATLRKTTGKILVKLPDSSNIYNKAYVFRDADWLIKDLAKHRKFIVYGTNDDKELLTKLEHLKNGCSFSNIQIVLTAKVNHKYFELLPNAIEVNKLMEGKTKYFGYFVSLRRLYKAFDDELKELYTTINLV